MEHAYFRDRVSGYFDHSLPPQEQVIVEEHIQGCRECQKLLAEIEKLDQLVQKHVELGGSDEYWEKAAQRIERRLGFPEVSEIVDISRSRWYSGLTWKVAAVAASAVLLVYIGYHKSDILKEREMNAPSQKALPPVDTTRRAKAVSEIPFALTDTEVPVKTAPPQEKAKQVPEMKKGIPPSPAISEPSEAVSGSSKYAKEAAPGLAAESAAAPPEVASQPMVMEKASASPPSDTGAMYAPPVPQAQPQNLARKDERDSQNAVIRGGRASDQGIMLDGIDSASMALELKHWREVRDSLLAVLKSEESAAKKGLNLPSATSQGLTGGTPIPTLRDTQELRLLSACYNVARLTTDSSEYNAARGVIARVASQVSSPNRQAATNYLQQLKKR